MNPPKRKTVTYGKNSKVIDTPGTRVIKTQKTLGSGAVEKTKSVTKFGKKGYVTKEKYKVGSNKTERKVRGYDNEIGGGPHKYTKTGVGSALTAKKMMKKYK